MSTEKPPPSGQQPPAAKPAVPQTTPLFRAMNFELFVKPNKVVMIAGIVAFTGAVSYLAYYRATVVNQPNSYMALTEQGELEQRSRTSRWD